MSEKPTDKQPIICEPCGHECDVMTSTEYGETAYIAYAAAVGGLAHDRSPLATWAEMQEHKPIIARAWMEAADAVRSAVASEILGQVERGTPVVRAAHGCPAHGAHPHDGALCLDCPACAPMPR